MFFISVLNPKGEEAFQDLCPKGKTVSMQEWNEDELDLNYPGLITSPLPMLCCVGSDTNHVGPLASSTHCQASGNTRAVILAKGSLFS